MDKRNTFVTVSLSRLRGIYGPIIPAFALGYCLCADCWLCRKNKNGIILGCEGGKSSYYRGIEGECPVGKRELVIKP